MPQVPDNLINQWQAEPEFVVPGVYTSLSMTTNRLHTLLNKAADWGFDQRHQTDNGTTSTNQDPSQQSDGYHSFAELYEHRHALCLALMRAKPDVFWYSRRHHDGELCFGDGQWFIVGANLPTGQISYHLPIALWPAAVTTGAQELEYGKEWDGHNPDDVVDRLMKWVLTNGATTCQPNSIGG